MAQKFLRRLEVNPCGSKVSRQGATEAVPANRRAFDPRPLECRTDDLFEQGVRDKNRTSRGREQVVFRNGHGEVAAKFRGSEQLGLPSTTDRDKFIALLKSSAKSAVRTAQTANPIRFSVYRLIQEFPQLTLRAESEKNL